MNMLSSRTDDHASSNDVFLYWNILTSIALASFLSPRPWNHDLELAGRALRTALQVWGALKTGQMNRKR